MPWDAYNLDSTVYVILVDNQVAKSSRYISIRMILTAWLCWRRRPFCYYAEESSASTSCRATSSLYPPRYLSFPFTETFPPSRFFPLTVQNRSFSSTHHSSIFPLHTFHPLLFFLHAASLSLNPRATYFTLHQTFSHLLQCLPLRRSGTPTPSVTCASQ